MHRSFHLLLSDLGLLDRHLILATLGHLQYNNDYVINIATRRAREATNNKQLCGKFLIRQEKAHC